MVGNAVAGGPVEHKLPLTPTRWLYGMRTRPGFAVRLAGGGAARRARRWGRLWRGGGSRLSRCSRARGRSGPPDAALRRQAGVAPRVVRPPRAGRTAAWTSAPADGGCVAASVPVRAASAGCGCGSPGFAGGHLHRTEQRVHGRLTGSGRVRVNAAAATPPVRPMATMTVVAPVPTRWATRRRLRRGTAARNCATMSSMPAQLRVAARRLQGLDDRVVGPQAQLVTVLAHHGTSTCDSGTCVRRTAETRIDSAFKARWTSYPTAPDDRPVMLATAATSSPAMTRNATSSAWSAGSVATQTQRVLRRQPLERLRLRRARGRRRLGQVGQQHDRPGAAGPGGVDRAVARDREQPGAEVVRVAARKRAQVAHHLQPRLGGDVLGHPGDFTAR